MKTKQFMLAAALLATMAVTAQTHNIVVDAKKAGVPIQPTMYGLFFEDINYAADGGLYGELVKNRSFEFPQHFMGWQTFGSVELKNDGPFERCPHYVTLRDPGHAHRRSGLINEGYFGIGLKQGDTGSRYGQNHHMPKVKSACSLSMLIHRPKTRSLLTSTLR